MRGKGFRSFLIFSLLLILTAGCGQKKIYKIGISQCSTDDWREKMNEEVIREAILHDDVEVVIRSADDNSQKQIEDLEYFLKNGYDAIIVAPNEAEPLTNEVRKIYESGIPVIIFDRNIYDTTYTQRISVDNERIGELAAKYAYTMLPDSLKVLEIYGLEGSSPAEERSIGFHKIFKGGKGKILGKAAADWVQDKAEHVSDSLIRLFPEVNLIFAHNDRMAIGARYAAKKLGREDIKIIGVDGAPKIGITAVADSIIDATFLYPTEGDVILKEAINIVHGAPFEKEVMLPTASAVDKTNADILLLQNNMMEADTHKVMALKGILDDYLIKHSAQTMLLYAFIIMLLLLFAFLFLVLRSFWQNRRHQEQLTEQNRLLEEERDKQKELNEKLEEATQSKLTFFTNVSHDLRTPLTLISEPVEQLSQAGNLNERQLTLVKLANKNVKILSRLINQILDFRKFESNKLHLHLTEIDFSHVIEEWTESFMTLAKKRDIKLTLHAPDNKREMNLAIDVDKIERVFFNLVSNAIKYSPDNSSIDISYKIEKDNLILKVADTGEGISREDLIHIFDRFFQVDRIRPKGSGIGLWLAKAFVELHGGSMTVESELKKGSVFTITLPVKHVAEKAVAPEKTITEKDVAAELEEIESNPEFNEDKPILLVIDDNRDIRQLVSEIMQDDYNVLTASDGKEGIRKATRYVPDLIICDVMMPGMDGMECCVKLKSETVTSHIPVLMLTACSLDEQRVEGFESGADGYISKPFSSPVLKAHAASLIANRKRIKDLLNPSNITITDKDRQGKALPQNPSSKIDNDFYNRFLEIFESRMSNPDLGVETIAAELGFERTQLYRKIKAITNYSPVELMRNLRLKKARTLLVSTDKSISEIGYEVGFSTPAYFTKCYREQYGETPSETRGK